MNASFFSRVVKRAVEGGEWLLLRSFNWVFPTAIPWCCENETVVERSMGDLGGSMPKWGSQDKVDGPGACSDPGTHDLQTHTFVPETSRFLLLVIGAMVMAFRHGS